GVRVKRVELLFRNRRVPPSHPDRNVVESAWREAAVEMTKPGDQDFHHRHADIGAGLVEPGGNAALLFFESKARLPPPPARPRASRRPNWEGETWTAGPSRGTR